MRSANILHKHIQHTFSSSGTHNTNLGKEQTLKVEKTKRRKTNAKRIIII